MEWQTVEGKVSHLRCGSHLTVKANLEGKDQAFYGIWGQGEGEGKGVEKYWVLSQSRKAPLSFPLSLSVRRT